LLQTYENPCVTFYKLFAPTNTIILKFKEKN